MAEDEEEENWFGEERASEEELNLREEETHECAILAAAETGEVVEAYPINGGDTSGRETVAC